MSFEETRFPHLRQIDTNNTQEDESVPGYSKRQLWSDYLRYWLDVERDFTALPELDE
jgi:hypothetical protein